MNSNELFRSLLKIGEEGSTKTKAEDLYALTYVADQLLSNVMLYTYDPFRRYGVRQLKEYMHGSGVFKPQTFGLLDDLADRKVTGHAALQLIAAEMKRLSPESGQLFRRILLKDLGIGVGEATINKLWKNLIPVAPYMRCALQLSPKTGKGVDLQKWPWEAGIYSQVKEDGMFVNVDVHTNGCAYFASRAGRRLEGSGLDWLISQAEQTFAPGTQTHGELIVYLDGKPLKRQTGNGLINSVAQGGELPAGHVIKLVVWDQIPLSSAVHKGRCDTPYSERFASLCHQMIADGAPAHRPNIQLVESKLVTSYAEALAHYFDVLRRGLEGTVVKLPDMDWHDTGDGSNQGQVKLKVDAECSLRVVDFLAGKSTGKNKALFGSLLCRSECHGLEAAVSGFTDKDRKMLHDMGEGIVDLIMDVTFNDIVLPKKKGAKYSLFLPRYSKLRPDKSVADDMAKIQHEYDSVTQVQAVVTPEPVQSFNKRITRTRQAAK